MNMEKTIMEGHMREHGPLYTLLPIVMFDEGTWVVVWWCGGVVVQGLSLSLRSSPLSILLSSLSSSYMFIYIYIYISTRVRVCVSIYAYQCTCMCTYACVSV